MEILLIVIVVVIISIVSAAGKKKANQSSEDAPVRPTMSDIQRAFMMSSEDARPRREAPRQTAVSPMAARQAVPQQATERLKARSFDAPTATSDMARSKYANIDPRSYRSGNSDINDDAPLKVIKQKSHTLKLFEDKDDFVRAVIYSEILPRKTR